FDYLAAIDCMDDRLKKLGFDVHKIKISSLIPVMDNQQSSGHSFEDERILSLMDAGDAFRKKFSDGAALVKLALLEVLAYRKEAKVKSEGGDIKPIAYVFLSLKNPKELELLRDIYEDAFVAISFYQPRDRRVDSLARRIARTREAFDPEKHRSTAEQIVNRDEQAGSPLGQRVSEVFANADYFISMTNRIAGLRAMERFIDILFGHPFITPTVDEYGMFLAWGVSLRSADLSRQVGAALCDSEGNLIAVGCNDVPRAGGGQYWPSDDDGRDFQRGFDSSAFEKKQLVAELIYRLSETGWLEQSVAELSSEEQIKKLMGNGDASLLKGIGINNLLEFGRIVHAEMAAIADAARRGLAVQDATLFVTTFPCHVCARHIVAAGAKRVVYIEPYPKSRAKDLHDDSLVVDSPKLAEGKVTFQAFNGISPRRYGSMFSMVQRKNSSGKAVRAEPSLRQRRFKSAPDRYITQEDLILDEFDKALASAEG
ncbi:MAG TPA: anti-phage dCTP deaminase, partial [Dokdonella sp.]|uniref:anti-phage dCTP deaminase n=1 Tax=Dokdonella sp. TaxID=2291710 RepID=UPI002D810EB0